MRALKIKGVTLHPGTGRQQPDQTVRFDRRGVTAGREPHIGWPQLAGLDSRRHPQGCLLTVLPGSTEISALLPGRAVADVRSQLRDWAFASSGQKLRLNLLWDPVAGVAISDAVARRIRIAGPVTGDTLLGWVASSERARQEGNLARAEAILTAVVEVGVEALGPAASAVVAARNNLAWVKGVDGNRPGAIDIYWSLLDDVTEDLIAAQPVGSDAFTSLSMARTNARRNLAMLHNPAWRP
jgi:hypothetical protein